MSEASAGDEFVTQAEIARIADVGPSAVANWRKRHADFPAAVQESSYGILFAKSQVIAWLRDNDKATGGGFGADAVDTSGDVRAGQQDLWQALGPFRSWLRASDFPLCVAGVTLALDQGGLDWDTAQLDSDQGGKRVRSAIAEWIGHLGESPTFWRLASTLVAEPDAVATLARAVVSLEPGEALDLVLDRERGRDPFKLNDDSIDRRLADFMVELIGSQGRTLDPFVRDGRVLSIAGRSAVQEGMPFEGLGFAPNPSSVVVAQALVSALPVPVEVLVGSPTAQSLGDGDFDRIFSVPPLGLRVEAEEVGAVTAALMGNAIPRTSDLYWVAFAAAHLGEGGRAIVLTGLGGTFRGVTDERARAELVRRGCVEAVIALPGSVNLALWLLRKPDSEQRTNPIFLVDATGLDWRDDFDGSASAVADTLNGLRAGKPKGHVVPHAVVNPLDALGPGVNLNAVTEAAKQSVLNPEGVRDLITTLNETRGQLAAAQSRAAAVRMRGAKFTPRPVLKIATIQELASRGHLSLLTGRHVPPEDRQASGVPIWTTQRVSPHPVATEFLASRGKRPMTQPGDVIFFPVGSRIRAVVDEVGGSVLASPLVALRLDPSYESLTPHVLAAILSSSATQRLSAGTTVGRVDVKSVPIPTLDSVTCSRADDIFRSLASIASEADLMADLTRNLADGLGSALDVVLIRPQLPKAASTGQESE